METKDVNIQDRVRENTSHEKNKEIDESIRSRMDRYRDLSLNEINKRLEKIGREWDIEKTLEVNAASLALAGILLGTFGSKRWFVLPFVVAGFLLQHSLQGWGPPLSLLRSLGARTRSEIAEEIYALKALRGDFDNISSTSHPEDIIAAFRK